MPGLYYHLFSELHDKIEHCGLKIKTTPGDGLLEDRDDTGAEARKWWWCRKQESDGRLVSTFWGWDKMADFL